MNNQFDQHTSALTGRIHHLVRRCASLCLQLVLWRYLALFRALEQHEKAKQTDQPIGSLLVK